MAMKVRACELSNPPPPHATAPTACRWPLPSSALPFPPLLSLCLVIPPRHRENISLLTLRTELLTLKRLAACLYHYMIRY